VAQKIQDVLESFFFEIIDNKQGVLYTVYKDKENFLMGVF